MSRIYRRALVVLSLVALLGIFAGNAAAETVYTYDFERVSAGNLDGNDGWYKVTGTTNSNQVADSSTTWSGNYIYNQFSTSDSQSCRANDTSWSYTLVQDEDFDVSVEVLVIGNSSSNLVYAGIQQREGESPDKSNWLFAGAQYGELLWRIKFGSDDTEVYPTMDTGLEGDVEKVFLVGIEATALGSGQYSLQPYYQNLTDGGVKTDYGSANTYTINDVATRWDSLTLRTKGNGELDNLRISSGQVPEPSTLALLACGLVGLLAYAWRKRK